MEEAKVRKIYESVGSELNAFTATECREADSWIKQFALDQLRNKLKDQPKEIRDYIQLMARCYFGSTETDEFLSALNCYPDWMT